MGTGSFPAVKCGQGVVQTTHPHLALRFKKEQSYTSTPPMGLRGLFYGKLYLYLYLYFHILQSFCLPLARWDRCMCECIHVYTHKCVGHAYVHV